MIGRDKEVLRKLKQDFTEIDGFYHGDAVTIQDFLGIRLEYNIDPLNSDNKRINMTQTGLINNILKDIGFLDKHGSTPGEKKVPAKGPLCSDPEGAPFDAKWNYHSMISKLNFLAQNTRPDIAFAVHQCARFSAAPKKCHQEAVKHLCRYLYGTRDKGMILTPNKDHQISAFIDADFAGIWSKDTAHTRESAMSRGGFIICYAGCPVLWQSKLLPEIALSTCEAEYIALSLCARSVIPMRTLLDEILHFSPAKPVKGLTRPCDSVEC